MAALGRPHPLTRGRRRRLARLLLGAAVAWGFSNAAAGAQTAIEYAVKANYLYKFGPFVEWPPRAFSGGASPFTVCVVGEDPFGSALDDAIRGQTVNGHPVVAKRLATISAESGCHVAYLGRTRTQSPAEILRLLQGTPTLTVTDERQGGGGGILHFVVQSGRVRFALDGAAAQASGLVISSKLQELAVARAKAGG